MPPINDGTVSRNTYLGSDNVGQATKKKGYGGVVSRNGRRLFDYEQNEAEDIIAGLAKDSNYDVWTDGIVSGDVFDDGISRDSFKVSYSSGAVIIAAGRARLAGFTLNLFADVSNSGGGSIPGLAGWALPVGPAVSYIYVDIYDREVETNGSNPYVDATPVSNGNDPYLVSPLGEMGRRYQFFNFRTDITFAASIPAPVSGHHYLVLASIDSVGDVTDLRKTAIVQNVFLPGAIQDVTITLSGNSALPRQANVQLEVSSGVSDTLQTISPAFFTTGMHLLFRTATVGHTITVKTGNAGTGGLILADGKDAVLSDPKQILIVKLLSTGKWTEVSRNFNRYEVSVLPGIGANAALVITANSVTPIAGNHIFSGSGSINTINPVNLLDGGLLLLRGTTGNSVTLVNLAGGSGQIATKAGDNFTLVTEADYILLQFDATAGTWREITRSGGANINPSDFNARLTLSSGEPITTTDQLAKTTVYLTQYKGSKIALYTGGGWAVNVVPEISIAVPNTSDQMYDVFVFLSAGVPTLELIAWGNDTTRASALAVQDGIYVKTGAPTHRYVGSFRTTATAGKTEDSAARRYVWNYYNRIQRKMSIINTNMWTYNSTTIRQANNDTTNQLNFIIGVSEDPVQGQVSTTFSVGGGSNGYLIVALGLNSTTVAATDSLTSIPEIAYPIGGATGASNFYGFCPIGKNFLAWIEMANPGTPPPAVQPNSYAMPLQGSGMLGSVFG